jgi:hypothetical protein
MANPQKVEPGGAIDDALWLMVPLVAVVGFGSGLSPLFHGFYSFSVWGVLTLAMLSAALALVLGAQNRLSGASAAALAAVVALACLALLSVTWAESTDSALTGASRWILYATTFAVLVIAGRRPGVARVGIAAATAGILVMAAYVLGKMISGDGGSLFLRGRLNDPLGYSNSQGLFPVLGMWPLIGLASYARPAAAGAAAGGGTVLMGLAFLSQSRSVALAVLLATLAALLLVPGRVRRAWLLLAMVAGVAAISSPLLHVYDVGRVGGQGLDEATRRAAWWILVAGGGVGLAWGAIVAGERRFRAAELRRASAVALGAVVLAGAVAGGVRAGYIRTYVHDQVHAFTALQPNTSRSRLISGGGNRYDFWRIAAHEFADHPLAGVGADNYPRDYFVLRRTNDEIRQPHSIEFQTLAELGLLGILALAAFFVAAAVGAVRRLRVPELAPTERMMLTAAIGMFTAWVGHSSVDWSHLVPGAAGVALMAAAYLVTGPSAGDVPAPRPRRATSVAIRVVATVGIVVGAVVVGRSLLGVHYLNQGMRALAEHPAQAIQKANDSLAFNGDSLDALYLKSAGYARLGDYRRSRAPLVEATKLEPHNFVPWALLGDLAVRRGQVGLARSLYAHALRLNPRDFTLQALVRNPRS